MDLFFNICLFNSLLLFILLLLFLAAWGLSCGTRDLCWGMRDLFHYATPSAQVSLQLRCTGFSLVVACGFSLSSWGARAPGRVGSVVCGTQALSLRRMSSIVVMHGLSCPASCGNLVPRPGIELASPALEGGFFTTGPPEKSPAFIWQCCYAIKHMK